MSDAGFPFGRVGDSDEIDLRDGGRQGATLAAASKRVKQAVSDDAFGAVGGMERRSE